MKFTLTVDSVLLSRRISTSSVLRIRLGGKMYSTLSSAMAPVGYGSLGALLLRERVASLEIESSL